MQDLECPTCGGGLAELACSTCGMIYDVVLGVPFIGQYEREDALGLIEIAAGIADRDSSFFTAETVEQVETLCAKYNTAIDKTSFVKENPLVAEWWFEAPYNEFLGVNRLLDGISLRGKDVLDVGAGLGFDSHRLALRGAKVTALESSPLWVSNGQKSFPRMRWIGGLSHALPFKTHSFDAVFFNAALHHMRDLPTAIGEALRVLRVGGILITSGDPFCPTSASAQQELEIFDKHSSVLLGVNEQIPIFDDFVATLRKHARHLKVEIFTHMLYGGRSGSGPDLREWAAWSLDADGDILAQRSGSLAMRITVLEPLPQPRALQTRGILKPAEYVSWMEDEAIAVSRLAAMMPSEYVDRPFPATHSKFDLLNGWRLPSADKPGIRTAYRRARWFLTRQQSPTLSLVMRSPAESDFEFRLSGEVVCQKQIGPDWTEIDLPVQWIAIGERFVVEVKRLEAGNDFEATCFDVRELRHGP